MTYLEKLKMDHPTLFDTDKSIDIPRQFCPYNFGYGGRDANICYSNTCEECWNREIPEENKTEEPKKKPIDIQKLLDSTCVTVEFPDDECDEVVEDIAVILLRSKVNWNISYNPDTNGYSVYIRGKEKKE